MSKIFAGVLSAAALISATWAPSASADPIGSGQASAYGVQLKLADNTVIEPTPTAEVAAPTAGEDASEAEEIAIPVDADPLAVNGTLIARAAVHQASDLESLLEHSEQEIAGPYNARSVGQVEDLEVLIDAVEPDVPLLEADLVRGEAVAVCSGGAVQYAGNSEVVNLSIAGNTDLNGPLNDLVDQIAEGIEPLADLVDIDVNVVTVNDTGATVDALVLTVLAPASPTGLVEVRLGHAEVTGVGCGAPTECSDTQDNDGDGVIDAEDPGCHSDGDATNPDSYDPTDDSEADGTGVGAGGALPGDASEGAVGGSQLPKTGGAGDAGVAAVIGVAALGLLALRRRLAVG